MTTSRAALASSATAPAGAVGRRRKLAAKLTTVLCVFAAAAGLIAVLTDGAASRTVDPVIQAAQPPVEAEVAEPAEASAEPMTSASRVPGPTHPADSRWLSRVSAATGIPRRALSGYASAALTLAREQPGCGLSWNTLAGIGAVESSHGGHQDGQLLDSGLPSAPIRGPALNGDGLGMIRDSDNGRWDGDANWDRAIGPMQFIPATWRRWGADGNGDGTADPNQIDDAALAAGRYLCASGSMRTAAGWRAAIYSYNHSDAYVDRVAGFANSYAGASRGAVR